MNKTLLSVLGIAVVLVGGYFLMKSKPAPTNTMQTNDQVGTQASGTDVDTMEADSTTTNTTTATTKEFTVSGSNFAFSPSTLSANKGDTVKIIFKNTEGMHDFRIDEFHAMTSVLSSGKEQAITFVADRAGTFEYYCSIGSHRAMGMKGTLTVK